MALSPLSTLAAAILAGVTIYWIPFNSPTYPYTIMQPSSFRFTVLQDSLNDNVDYFIPTLGSFPTNVNIFAYRGKTVTDEKSYLQDQGAKSVRQDGWITIMGKRLPLMRADFKGPAARWTVEQVALASHGWVWRLTASFEPQYKNLRSTMLHMLKSFKVRSSTSRAHH